MSNLATASGPTSSTESRALSLLGAGVSAEQVAAALGVSASRISQLLADESFSAQVTTLRYETLSRHNMRDSNYDTLEDTLAEKLSGLVPLMMRPMEVIKSLQIVNSLKRRGQSAPEQLTTAQQVVNITVPNLIVNKFVTNVQNQVIRAGQQELLTIQSSTLLKEREAQNGNIDSSRDDASGDDQEKRRYFAPTATKQEQSKPSAAIGFIPATAKFL